MKIVNQYAVEKLEKAGVKITEKVLHEKGGHVVVLDYVICSRGSHTWIEERFLTLKSFDEVINYIEEIS